MNSLLDNTIFKLINIEVYILKIKINIIIEDYITCWSDINCSVTRLRKKIFDAKKEKKYRDVRSLQKLMLK